MVLKRGIGRKVLVVIKKLSVMLDGKKILITGGTGSLGQALTKKLLKSDVDTIRILSRNENKQVQMSSELSDNRLRFLIGDIRDKERLETALDLMEANIKLTQQQTAEIVGSRVVSGAQTPSESAGTDMIHTVGEDGEVTSKPLDSDVVHAVPQIENTGGPNLLDLYEAQSLAVNPFLKSTDAGELLTGPSIDASKITALLLDNMGGLDTLKFIKNAGSSGLLSTDETKSLTAIATLAEKGESSEEQPTLSNRNLLIFY